MPSCEITYDNKSKGCYSSGETIKGMISFDNEENLKISSISLTFVGRAKCKWFKQKGQNYRKKYTGKEQYINEVKYLMGDAEGSEIDLPKDLYQFTFSFKTRENFPASVLARDKKIYWSGTHSLHGYVQYALIFKVVKSSSWNREIKYEFPISISKKYDLNSIGPKIRSPQSVEGTKQFKFSLNVLHMSVNAPITGFIPGQKGKFFVKYINESSVIVTETKIQLMRIIQCNADKPITKTKIGYEQIEKISFDGVLGNTSKDIQTYLTIPLIASSSDESCKVLNISYEIYITAVFKGLHRDFTLKIPVVIGSVPLEDTNW